MGELREQSLKPDFLISYCKMGQTKMCLDKDAQEVRQSNWVRKVPVKVVHFEDGAELQFLAEKQDHRGQYFKIPLKQPMRLKKDGISSLRRPHWKKRALPPYYKADQITADESHRAARNMAGATAAASTGAVVGAETVPAIAAAYSVGSA